MLSVSDNVEVFNRAFALYAKEWTDRGHGPLGEALEKKGRALGIALFRGFTEHKWGGAGRAPHGLAEEEFRARAAEGRGIKVRASLMAEYISQRGSLRAKLRGKKGIGAIKKKISLWQGIVKRELSARQRGIGVLAVSFLWYRARSNNARGTFYVRNRTGKPIGEVVRDDDSLRILGDVTGQEIVDTRYGIVQRALEAETGDMLAYLQERNEQLVEQFFGSFAQVNPLAI